MKIKEKYYCEKCGKEHNTEIDEEMSNENWEVRQLKWVCECGGDIKYEVEEDK